jgi:hypothetical protein
MRSISGKEPTRSQTATVQRNKCKANGANWDMEDVACRQLINLLLLLIGKSTDTQTVFGRGRCKSSNNNAIQTGTMNNKGLFWGDTSGTNGVKVFGIENYWGNIWRRTAGWIQIQGNQWIKLTYGTQDGSTATDYNEDGSGYIDTGVTLTSDQYISSMLANQYGLYPNNVSGGSASTQYCDYYYVNTNCVGYAYCGGNWGHGSYCGAFDVALNFAASHSGTSIGASPVCRPLEA